jgi:hypothetical protein
VVRVSEGDRETSILRKAWPIRVFCAIERDFNNIRDFINAYKHKEIQQKGGQIHCSVFEVFPATDFVTSQIVFLCTLPEQVTNSTAVFHGI